MQATSVLIADGSPCFAEVTGGGVVLEGSLAAWASPVVAKTVPIIVKINSRLHRPRFVAREIVSTLFIVA
jgi:hypothetical protein